MANPLSPANGNGQSLDYLIGDDGTARLHRGAGSYAPSGAANTSADTTVHLGVGTPLAASSTGGATALTATLGAASGKMTYITGFAVTGAGATAASVILVTVTGTTATLNYYMVIPAGAVASGASLSITFPIPVPASAVNTAVVVNVPSFGSGNTSAAVAAVGFRL